MTLGLNSGLSIRVSVLYSAYINELAGPCLSAFHAVSSVRYAVVKPGCEWYYGVLKLGNGGIG